jgi:hypothetical protein
VGALLRGVRPFFRPAGLRRAADPARRSARCRRSGLRSAGPGPPVSAPSGCPAVRLSVGRRAAGGGRRWSGCAALRRAGTRTEIVLCPEEAARPRAAAPPGALPEGPAPGGRGLCAYRRETGHGLRHWLRAPAPVRAARRGGSPGAEAPYGPAPPVRRPGDRRNGTGPRGRRPEPGGAPAGNRPQPAPNPARTRAHHPAGSTTRPLRAAPARRGTPKPGRGGKSATPGQQEADAARTHPDRRSGGRVGQLPRRLRSWLPGGAYRACGRFSVLLAGPWTAGTGPPAAARPPHGPPTGPGHRSGTRRPGRGPGRAWPGPVAPCARCVTAGGRPRGQGPPGPESGTRNALSRTGGSTCPAGGCKGSCGGRADRAECPAILPAGLRVRRAQRPYRVSGPARRGGAATAPRSGSSSTCADGTVGADGRRPRPPGSAARPASAPCASR